MTQTVTRSPETEAAAELMRRSRRQYAQRLREARRAAESGNPQARVRLTALRAQGCSLPNPDRRRSCAQHADQALKVYEDALHAPEADSASAARLLRLAARQADLFALLQVIAPY